MLYGDSWYMWILFQGAWSLGFWLGCGYQLLLGRLRFCKQTCWIVWMFYSDPWYMCGLCSKELDLWDFDTADCGWAEANSSTMMCLSTIWPIALLKVFHCLSTGSLVMSEGRALFVGLLDISFMPKKFMAAATMWQFVTTYIPVTPLGVLLGSK